MEQEDLKLKIKMPMIPLRDVVIFPNTVSTLFVGREKSIFSLEDALRSNKKIFLIAQNSPASEEPTIEDLPKIGTLSTLLQMIKLPDGTVKILVEGIQRARLESITTDEGYFAEIERPAECQVRYIDYNGKKKEMKANGLLATCIQHEVDHLNGILFIDYLSKLKRDMIIKKLVKNKKELNKIVL